MSRSRWLRLRRRRPAPSRRGNSGCARWQRTHRGREGRNSSLFDILNKPFWIVQLIALRERAHISLVTTARISAADYEENHHGKAQTRRQVHRLGHRPRLHGHVGFYGPADRSESIATIHAALDAGITLLDTGDFYGMGHNEMLIREAQAAIATICRSASSSARCAIPTRAFSAMTAARRRSGISSLIRCSGSRRHHRHLSARAARSGCADRGNRRRDGRHDQGRLDRAYRPFRGRLRHHSQGARRASDRRPADRIFAVARGIERHPENLPRARHRHHRTWRAGAADQRTLDQGSLRRAGFRR